MYTLILSIDILESLLGIEIVKNDDTHKIQSLKLYHTKLTFLFEWFKENEQFGINLPSVTI